MRFGRGLRPLPLLPTPGTSPRCPRSRSEISWRTRATLDRVSSSSIVNFGMPPPSSEAVWFRPSRLGGQPGIIRIDQSRQVHSRVDPQFFEYMPQVRMPRYGGRCRAFRRSACRCSLPLRGEPRQPPSRSMSRAQFWDAQHVKVVGGPPDGAAELGSELSPNRRPPPLSLPVPGRRLLSPSWFLLDG